MTIAEIHMIQPAPTPSSHKGRHRISRIAACQSSNRPDRTWAIWVRVSLLMRPGHTTRTTLDTTTTTRAIGPAVAPGDRSRPAP